MPPTDTVEITVESLIEQLDTLSRDLFERADRDLRIHSDRPNAPSAPFILGRYSGQHLAAVMLEGIIAGVRHDQYWSK